MATSAVQAQTSSTAEYGGFLERFVAVLIDGIILSVALFILRLPVRIVLGPFVGGLIMIPVNMLAAIAYEAYFLSSPMQATLGKQAMGLIVTDVEGRRIDMGRAALRAFGKIISCIILFIGYIMAAFTPRHQALHDMIAGTLVLKGKR